MATKKATTKTASVTRERGVKVSAPSAITVADPQNDPRATELKGNADGLVKRATSVKITDDRSLQEATAFLTTINGLVKDADKQRREFVDPLNAHVKKINAHFATISEPLKTLESELRRKILGYRQELEKKALEEQRKRDEEAAAKAAEAQRLRDEAERKKGKKAAALREQAEAAEAEALAVAEEPVALVPAKTIVGTGGAALTAKKRWTFEVLDESKVPRSYLAVDESAIRTAVASGIREIPGVRIFQTESLSVRA